MYHFFILGLKSCMWLTLHFYMAVRFPQLFSFMRQVAFKIKCCCCQHLYMYHFHKLFFTQKTSLTLKIKNKIVKDILLNGTLGALEISFSKPETLPFALPLKSFNKREAIQLAWRERSVALMWFLSSVRALP